MSEIDTAAIRDNTRDVSVMCSHCQPGGTYCTYHLGYQDALADDKPTPDQIRSHGLGPYPGWPGKRTMVSLSGRHHEETVNCGRLHCTPVSSAPGLDTDETREFARSIPGSVTARTVIDGLCDEVDRPGPFQVTIAHAPGTDKTTVIHAVTGHLLSHQFEHGILSMCRLCGLPSQARIHYQGKIDKDKIERWLREELGEGPQWRKMARELLDAYEAEKAEVLRLKGLWGAACDLNADLDVEREHAVVEAEILRLRANRAEAKLQAISELAAGWDSYDSVDLLTGIRAIIKLSCCSPRGDANR
jgi:hypothetical protein